MSLEQPTAQPEPSAQLQTLIAQRIGSPLDSFSAVQYSFFGACRSFAADPVSVEPWEVEHAALLLEFGVEETMQAIAASQKFSRDKLRMVHGFSVAEDTMRIELFRSLAPQAIFSTLQEEGKAASFDSEVGEILRQADAATALEGLITATKELIRKDVSLFSEAVLSAQDS